MSARVWVSLTAGWICATIVCLIVPHAIGIISQLAVIFMAGFGFTLILLTFFPKK